VVEIKERRTGRDRRKNQRKEAGGRHRRRRRRKKRKKEKISTLVQFPFLLSSAGP
jgi:hypothetical protein